MKRVFLVLLLSIGTQRLLGEEKVISISREHPRYFVDGSSGKTWIPIGCNICFDRLHDGDSHADNEVRANFRRWIRAFSENGGNCIRLWAGHRSLEVMPNQSAVFDEEKAKTLCEIVSLCEKLDIKIKITLESFRMCLGPTCEYRDYNHIFNRPLYACYVGDMSGFFKSEECRRTYLSKVQYLKRLGLGESSSVYCWEPWNEINACGTIAEYSEWCSLMLPELKKIFPRQLVVNNLGSLSDVADYQAYDELAKEHDNDFLQVHRYLDAGASLDVCRGPMDVVAASATRELLGRREDCPVVVAEIGAVQSNHAGPFPYYPFDKEGVLLHDAIFAPFFCGAAGCGQYWHWDHQYIDGNNLWFHFKRFATAIEGLDPVAEGFKPFYTESRRLRMYGLKGIKTIVVWCRDKCSSWEDELVHGNAAEVVCGERVPFGDNLLSCYLPWEDRHVTVRGSILPEFRRSIVVRVSANAVDDEVHPH